MTSGQLFVLSLRFRVHRKAAVLDVCVLDAPAELDKDQRAIAHPSGYYVSDSAVFRERVHRCVASEGIAARHLMIFECICGRFD